MKKYSLSALAAAGLLAGGLSVTSASAADLGGNCCADLEERIAELEATTARKGNRKVSLTVSGWVAEQVMWWDDGKETNAYVGGIGSTLGTNVKFTGQATISPGWSAGYVIHLEADGADDLTWNQNRDNGPGALAGTFGYVQALQTYWFVKSDQLGKVSVGYQSQASDNTAILVDGSGSLVPANWVAFDVNGFFIRSAVGAKPLTALTWGGIGGCIGGGAWGDCNGFPEDVVRYDSPTFAGFSVSASWGEDDMWDVAARYAGEFSGFKIAVAAAYNEFTDGVRTGIGGDTFEYFQVGAYIQHVPTGIFVYGAYGDSNFDIANGDSQTYYIKAGLRQRWNHLGHTVLYGEYENVDGDGAFARAGTGGEEQLDMWGGGVVQEIDNAAMSMWIKYRHLSYDDNLAATRFEDFDQVSFGALINF